MTHGFVRHIFFSRLVRRAFIWTPWFSSRMKIHPVSRPTHAGCDSETLVS
jgi:hypothetical protein